MDCCHDCHLEDHYNHLFARRCSDRARGQCASHFKRAAAASLCPACSIAGTVEKILGPGDEFGRFPPTPAEAAGAVPRLTIKRPGGVAHIMPTIAVAAARQAAAAKQGPAPAAPPVLASHGGPVMYSNAQIYTIFWRPSSLQNGAWTGFSPKYVMINYYLAAFIGGHGIQNIATQYYQTIGGTTAYVQNAGFAAGYYLDTSPYPPSGCTDIFTPGNCITDAQIQAEIARVMAINGWTGGLSKVFLLFTSFNEGSCFDSSSASCAYSQYCAYHGYFMQGSTPVIYGNIPFARPSACLASGQTLPNGDTGDIAANPASHEIEEAVTDPLLNAWFDSSGNENGDLCNFVFGANTWAGRAPRGTRCGTVSSSSCNRNGTTTPGHVPVPVPNRG
jgi:hypothetical protein